MTITQSMTYNNYLTPIINLSEIFQHTINKEGLQLNVKVVENYQENFIITMLNTQTNSKVKVVRNGKNIGLFYYNPKSSVLFDFELQFIGYDRLNQFDQSGKYTGFRNLNEYEYTMVQTGASYPNGYKTIYDNIHKLKIQNKVNKVATLCQEQARRLDEGLLIQDKNYNNLFKNLKSLLLDFDKLDK
jgi:hypothetical protein